MALRLELPIPVSANRYWRHFQGRTVLSSDARKFRQTVATIAMASGIRSPLQGEVRVVYTYHPKARKKETKSPMRRLDVGNIEKVTADALNGIAWLDDYQIVDTRTILGAPDPVGKVIVTWEAV